jgi:hypothetical protein
VIKINHLMTHLFRKAIPTVALNAAQILSLIARNHLWQFTWHVDFLKELHQIAKYPFDYPTFPNLVILPFELDFPVFASDDWKFILASHENSIAYHVWLCCPPLQQALPSVLATEVSRRELLAKCAHGLSLFGCHDFSTEETLGSHQGYAIFRALFNDWAAHAPAGLSPLFQHFPVILSCVVSRLMSPFDIPFASPSAYMMTGSQLFFFWHKAIMTLDRMIGPDARIALLKNVFIKIPRHGGKTYTYMGDPLLTLIQLVYNDYVGLLQPSFFLAYDDLAMFALQPSFEVGWAASRYLSAVYQGQLRETHLDPIFHYYLLDCLSLTITYPDIFSRQLPPMDWSFYFPPSTIPPTPQPFEEPCPNDYAHDHWSHYLRHESLPEIITSLRFTDGTLQEFPTD